MNDREALEKALALRTRLYGLRTRAALGMLNVDELLRFAYDRSMMKDFEYYEGEDLNPVKITFGDRTRDKVRALLVPCGLYGHDKEVLTAVALSQERALMEERSTYDAQIFYALQFVLNENKVVRKDDVKIIQDQEKVKQIEKRISKALSESKISITEVRDRLNEDIDIREGVKDNKGRDPKENEGRDDYETRKKSTRFVGNILRNNLSFSTKEGAGRKHYLTARGFIESYRSCLSAFGNRFDIEEET
ncbi:MAG: hypothetical protein LUQ09_07730 [Methanomassiliicoccales archaeon]|nr:hypothetical protein [Methanomassiliicoccales archaeon]